MKERRGGNTLTCTAIHRNQEGEETVKEDRGKRKDFLLLKNLL